MGMDLTMAVAPGPTPGYKPQYDNDPSYYRFRTPAMALMVQVMRSAGVISDEPAPEFPPWPPEGVPEDRVALLDQAMGGGDTDALTTRERVFLEGMRHRLQAARATPSRAPGKVPAFKFTSNDGWIVSVAECAAIARAVREYAMRITEHDLAALEREYDARQKAMTAPMIAQGHVMLLGNQPLGLELPELKIWLAEWAMYNEVASSHGGYRVD
jgi:hypothetical protein